MVSKSCHLACIARILVDFSMWSTMKFLQSDEKTEVKRWNYTKDFTGKF